MDITEKTYLMIRVKRAATMKILSNTASAMRSLWKVSWNSFLFMMSTVTVLPENMMLPKTCLTRDMITKKAKSTDNNRANSFHPERKNLVKLF